MNNKRKSQQDFFDPVDFNPSLYPTTTSSSSASKIRRVTSPDNSNSNSTKYTYNNKPNTNNNNNNNNHNNNHNHNNMSKRRTTNWGRSSNVSSGVDNKAIEKMFDEIMDEDDPDIASMEGICKIAEQLNVDPIEDIRILVLLHKLGANEKPAQISRAEWIKGCQTLQTDSIGKFQALLPSLDVGFMVDSEFRDFYKFCFQFNRQGTHKTLDKDLVKELVVMPLKDRIPQDRLSSFIEFLEQTDDTSYNRITLDQWMSFYDFCKECDDLSKYDEENSAWPVLIDWSSD